MESKCCSFKKAVIFTEALISKKASSMAMKAEASPVTNGNAPHHEPTTTISTTVPKGVKYRPREVWERKLEFLLSVVGFSVGLGNVWRFPYLCFENGGGAFLIPYVICIVTGGIPVFFLEVALGQFMAQGGISAWSICPIFKGIGYGTIVIEFLLNIYYIVVLAWALLFLIYSLGSVTSELPWTRCGNEWNTERCHDFNLPMANYSGNHTNLTAVDPTVEFWENKVLKLTAGVDDMGSIRWELFATLLAVWVICYFCIWKGIKSTGKVVYFTTTFPYLMITVLLIRGVTLDGAYDGIVYYLKPEFSKLLNSKVWIDAGTQIFFSYAVALGGMTALGSYNKFNNNCYKDVYVLATINSCTSFYSGFAIFSVLGFMAKQQGVSVEEVAASGPGLVFIAYPKAVTQLPLAPLWAVLFFLMIIFMGLDSQFVQMEGLITSIVDVFPHYLRVGYRREWFIAIVSFVTFLCGIPLVMEGGAYVFKIFDYYSASGVTLLWFCFFETVCIGWVYGADRFYDDIESMLGFRINPWMKWCWKFITPFVCFAIFAFSAMDFQELTFNKTYVFPTSAMAFGWCLALMSMICIPGYAIFALMKTPGTLKERLRILTTPVYTRQHVLEDNLKNVPLMEAENFKELSEDV